MTFYIINNTLNEFSSADLGIANSRTRQIYVTFWSHLLFFDQFELISLHWSPSFQEVNGLML